MCSPLTRIRPQSKNTGRYNDEPDQRNWGPFGGPFFFVWGGGTGEHFGSTTEMLLSMDTGAKRWFAFENENALLGIFLPKNRYCSEYVHGVKQIFSKIP